MLFKVALLSVIFAAVYSTPVDNVESIDPLFDAYRDVRLMLQTRQNRDTPQLLQFRNLQSVQNSNYNANRPTRVLIHGWGEDSDGDIEITTATELLNYYDFNVIYVDWSEGSSTINYVGAANRVPTVGRFVASFLDFLSENNLLQWNRVGLVGFSLGAHIAGHIGKNVRAGRVNHILGLDPAGPLFSVRNPEGRLDAADATYVECMHTNGPTLLVAGAGIGAPIGDADFWPNGGTSQPGCLTNSCSHGRAVAFYVESVANSGFFARQCPERDDISSRRCTIEPGAWMAGDAINYANSLRGSFYLETERRAPFALGPERN